jgi:hypothetical protein
MLLHIGICIEASAAGFGMQAFIISSLYRSIPVPDWVSLICYRLFPASALLFISVPVPDYLDAGQSGILKISLKGDSFIRLHRITGVAV